MLLVVVLGYDLWAWFRPPPAGSTVRVAIVQPNIPLAVKHDPDVTWAEVAGKTGRAAASFLRGRPGARGD